MRLLLLEFLSHVDCSDVACSDVYCSDGFLSAGGGKPATPPPGLMCQCLCMQVGGVGHPGPAGAACDQHEGRQGNAGHGPE